jgi:pilus assembly protein CpaB
MKNKFPLVVAVVIGIVALLAIRQYVNKVEDEANQKLRGERVVAASIDIPVGTEITFRMLEPKEVPPQFIPVQAIRGSDQVKQILGSKTRVAVKQGSILLWSDLASEEAGGLSSIIPQGEGAFTVAIPRGVQGGLIQPSDHIDIIASFPLPKSTQPVPNTSASFRKAPDVVNVVLLQNVTVLAVGDAFGGAPKMAGATSSGGQLTLALKLQEAQLIMFANQYGELGAVLRRSGAPDLVERSKLPRVTFDDLEKIIGDLDDNRNFRAVEVKNGSEIQTMGVGPAQSK